MGAIVERYDYDQQRIKWQQEGRAQLIRELESNAPPYMQKGMIEEIKKGLNAQPLRMASKRFNAGSKRWPNRQLVFINGIDTPFDGEGADNAVSHANYLSNIAGGAEVEGVWNATFGSGSDVFESQMNLRRIATTPVKLLHEAFNEFFSRSPIGELLLVAHSQGAIHARNAIESYRPKERLNRLNFLGISPAAYTSLKSCKTVAHYLSSKDLVPKLDREGRAMAIREGTYHVVIEAHKETPPGWIDYLMPGHYLYIKARDNINGVGTDHGFQTPFYRPHIAEKVNKFLGKLNETSSFPASYPT